MSVERIRPEREQLTYVENKLLTAAGSLATGFSQLPELHPSDRDEIAYHVHAIQNIILARAAYPRSARSTINQQIEVTDQRWR